MAAHALGRDTSVETVQLHATSGDVGTTLLALQRAASALGLAARAIRVGPERLGDVSLPAVAHLGGGHYVTLFEAGPGGVVIGDPETGILIWDRATFARAWSGHLLLLGPGGGQSGICRSLFGR